MLDRLQKMILKNKPGTWLVTYLVTFILLHNAALIIDHDASYASKHGMKVGFQARQSPSLHFPLFPLSQSRSRSGWPDRVPSPRSTT